MIEFKSPVKLRGIHAVYGHYLSKDKGVERIGGVNVFQRLVDAFMVGILVGLKYSKQSSGSDEPAFYKDYFNSPEEYGDKSVKSADIPIEVLNGCRKQLDYIYRVVMLAEDIRKISDTEKIANAFKCEGDEDKLNQNLKFMKTLANGGLEIMSERFRGLTDEVDILEAQLELFDDIGGFVPQEDEV